MRSRRRRTRRSTPAVSRKNEQFAKQPTRTRAQSVIPVPVIEDWWLVRDSHNRVGWVLGRMVDLDVPLDIAQYAEGQRIVAFFVLDQVQDGDKKVAQYLTVLTEPKMACRLTSTRFASLPGT